MQIPIEQLLNLPDIQALNVEITEREIRCEIESTRGYAICHRCGQRATKFFEHGETPRCAICRFVKKGSHEKVMLEG